MAVLTSSESISFALRSVSRSMKAPQPFCNQPLAAVMFASLIFLVHGFLIFHRAQAFQQGRTCVPTPPFWSAAISSFETSDAAVILGSVGFTILNLFGARRARRLTTIARYANLVVASLFSTAIILLLVIGISERPEDLGRFAMVVISLGILVGISWCLYLTSSRTAQEHFVITSPSVAKR